MSELYKRIDWLCKKNQTNVTAMCKKLELSRSSLTELKNGRSKNLSVGAIRKIADYFEVDVDRLTTPQIVSEEELFSQEVPIKVADWQEFALKREINDLTSKLSEEELQDILDYINFKSSKK